MTPPWKLAAVVVVGFGASGNVVRADRAAAPTVSPKANALLKKMSADLAHAKSFQCETRYATEVVTQDGEKIEVLGRSSLAVKRPNKLRSDRTGPNAEVSFFYDGKDVTVYGDRTNMYATAQAPATLDKTIDFTRDQLDLDAPAADLLYDDPYAVLMEDVVSGKYIGLEPVGDRTCHHLAYRGHETDWQIWIADGPQALPCRFEITSKKVVGQPEFAIEMTNWRIDPTLPAEMFVFTPPASATRISFMSAAEQQPGGKR
jgi:hypothetical protein